MHHGGHGGQMMAAAGGLGWGTVLPLLLLVAVLAAGAVLLFWWLSTRRRPRQRVADAGAAVSGENLEGQINAMLAQAGGELDQVQISSNLGLPVAEIAATLRRLEDDGFITRTWQPNGYTYLVRSARPASEQGAGATHPGGPASAGDPNLA